MDTRPLGATSTHVSALGLGTSAFTGGPEALRAGIAAGATFIDTAEIYGTEDVVGTAIRGLRQDVFVATKVWHTHMRRDALRRAAEDSLKRLGTDYIDLYQVHWPNPRVPIEETVGAMEDLVDAGLVRHLGVSNFSPRELEEALAAARRHPIVSNQVSFSLTDRRAGRDLLEFCRQRDVTLIAYSPLGRGLERMQARDRDGALAAVAAASGHTPAQVALNWCIGHPGVVAIPKANSAGRIEENCGASGWTLDEEQRRALEASIREGGAPYRRRGQLENMARAAAQRLLETVGLR